MTETEKKLGFIVIEQLMSNYEALQNLYFMGHLLVNGNFGDLHFKISNFPVIDMNITWALQW